MQQETHAKGRYISDMVVMLVSEQNCLKFLLSREGQAGRKSPCLYRQDIIN